MRRFVTPSDQVVAIRAGHLFDSHSGNMLANQIILIRGERIADVGPSVAIPAGATIIDLSQATVMPGMIDAHVHVNTGGASLAMRAITALANAQTDLAAGFTTVLDMDSRGGFYTVELRDAINNGPRPGTAHAGRRPVPQPARHPVLRRRPDVAFLRRVRREQEHQRAVARPRRRARSEAPRRRLRQDLHDAGFRRHRPTCGIRMRRSSTARR